MALQLILGSSGHGKTEYLMEEVIRESMENPTQQYYILVPEQFGLEMQRQMVMKHPRHGFSNIDILSFQRLAYRVFDECSYEPKEILEDLGVSMVLKKVMMDHEDDLLFFKKSMRKPGFIDEMKSILMEFTNYQVSASDIIEVEGNLKSYPGLSEKCSELGNIYSWFTEAISEHYMISGQILDILTTMVPNSKILQEGIFYLDGYTGFTPVQLSFLKELLPRTRKITATVTIPYMPGGNRKAAKEELFSFSEKTVYALMDLCKETGTEICDPIILQKDSAPRYGKHKELSHLEENLFHDQVEKYKLPLSDIFAVCCKNPEEEAEFVLHKIEELIRRQGYRYRDFAILMGNEEDYPSAFVRQSNLLNIPLFVDTKQKMVYHCGVETIRSLFHLTEMDYSYQSVFRYLKSGMSDLSNEDTDYLENYVIAAGVRGRSMWKKPFTRKLRGMEKTKIDYLDKLRLDFIGETLDFVENMRDINLTVRQKIQILYETLCKMKFPDKLKKKSREAEESFEYIKAKGYENFFRELLALMDKIVDIFGQEIMSVEELSQIFDAGLETLTLTTPPLSMDQTILGDLKRTRLPDIKVLFVVGVNDGDLPPVPEDRGILSDDEKRILDENGISLSLNLTERVLEDEYYMYLAFSKPEEGLYLSYCQSAADGSAKRPSSLFHIFKKVFQEFHVLTYKEETRRYYFNEDDSRELLLEGLRKWYEGQEPEEAAFYSLLAYWQQEHPEELSSLYEHMQKGTPWNKLSQDIVSNLYGEELAGSVSRFEKFAECPYKFFCTYGLELYEREEFQVRSVDIGNLFHGALEYFSNHIREEGYKWSEIPDDIQERLLDEAVEAVVQDSIKDVITSSARNNYKKKMVRRILRRTVDVLRYHLKNSSFEPDRFEMGFRPNDQLETTKIPLKDGHKIALQGVIDRVDICEEDDRLLVKIIDYKSGTKKFDFNELYYGLQMQLIVYLNTALEIYKKDRKKMVEPAGVFYYHIQDPIQNEDKAKSNVMKEFQMSGYANSDAQILDYIEHADSSWDSIAVKKNKNGSFSKTSKIMSTDDFYLVGEYVKESMRKIGERIYSGEVSAKPYKLGENSACTYCPYISICGFEDGSPGFEYRLLCKNDTKDIIEKIREEVE